MFNDRWDLPLSSKPYLSCDVRLSSIQLDNSQQQGIKVDSIKNTTYGLKFTIRQLRIEPQAYI